eukprot:1185683-Prorocentrum_minimum.AAC.7
MVNAPGMQGGAESYTFASEPRPVANRKQPKFVAGIAWTSGLSPRPLCACNSGTGLRPYF